jgi:uncharacterized membrane protein YciS (DUF1049 family)
MSRILLAQLETPGWQGRSVPQRDGCVDSVLYPSAWVTEASNRIMERKPQTYANHAKYDPKFHFILFPILAVNLVATITAAARNLDGSHIWAVVMALGLVVMFFTIRLYSLKVQTRLIRLEERMRLREVAPERLKERIGELSEDQLVALRFAPDAELPALVEKALTEKLGSKEIKQAIQNWRPDYFRV